MVIDFGTNQKRMYDFLLVINSNFGPISHRFWDTANYWSKIGHFTTPLSFSALDGVNFWKAVSGIGIIPGADCENLVI